MVIAIIWGIGESDNPLIRDGESTQLAFNVATRAGFAALGVDPNAWAVEVGQWVTEEDATEELEVATRFDPAARHYTTIVLP